MLNNGPYLVNTPAATAFLETVSIEAGRKSLLGDRENLPGRAYNAVGEAHIAIGESVPKITKLTKDETRNDVLKHEAAMHLAEKVAATRLRQPTGRRERPMVDTLCRCACQRRQ